MQGWVSVSRWRHGSHTDLEDMLTGEILPASACPDGTAAEDTSGWFMVKAGGASHPGQNHFVANGFQLDACQV